MSTWIAKTSQNSSKIIWPPSWPSSTNTSPTTILSSLLMYSSPIPLLTLGWWGSRTSGENKSQHLWDYRNLYQEIRRCIPYASRFCQYDLDASHYYGARTEIRHRTFLWSPRWRLAREQGDGIINFCRQNPATFPSLQLRWRSPPNRRENRSTQHDHEK